MRKNKLWLLYWRHWKEPIFEVCEVCSSLHWFKDVLLYYKLLQLCAKFLTSNCQTVSWYTSQAIYYSINLWYTGFAKNFNMWKLNNDFVSNWTGLIYVKMSKNVNSRMLEISTKISVKSVTKQIIQSQVKYCILAIHY